MISHQNHQQRLNGNRLVSFLLKSVMLCLFLASYLCSFSQEKIQFGYHDESGNVIDIEATQKDNNDNEDTLVGQLEDTLVGQLDIDSNNLIDSFQTVVDTSFLNVLSDITISVLLPLNTDKNTEFQQQLPTGHIEIHNTSRFALDFLEGILFAVDSFSALGKSVHLNIFDTKRDRKVVEEILNNNLLGSSDIIFGPIFSENYKLVRDRYRNDPNKVLVNPLSSRLHFLSNSHNIFFLNPVRLIMQDSISSFLYKDNKEVMIITYQDINKKDANLLKNKISTDSNNSVSVYNFNNLNDVDRHQCEKLIGSNGRYLVVMTDDEAFVNRFISFAGMNEQDVVIIGSPSWRKFTDLNIETLMKLNVHIPIPNFIDHNSLVNKQMFNGFEKRFYHQMNLHSYISFKSILHFVFDIPQFDFIKLSHQSGYVNTDVRMCVYRDYGLHIIE